VIDTNVLLDLYSCHDFEAVVVKHGADLVAISHPDTIYRRARAREAVILAVYLDRIEATTLSLQHEALDLIQRHVPPTARTSFGTQFTTGQCGVRLMPPC
jgi:hypothetical protein